jgi:peptidoglycan/LPS O-acetylase OafA/YrhL
MRAATTTALPAKKTPLHLWSLGIEEQFYIFWPLILWVSWKRRFNLLAITAEISFISFALNVFTVSRDVTADFYSPQTRFWELSIGSARRRRAVANTSRRYRSAAAARHA